MRVVVASSLGERGVGTVIENKKTLKRLSVILILFYYRVIPKLNVKRLLITTICKKFICTTGKHTG